MNSAALRSVLLKNSDLELHFLAGASTYQKLFVWIADRISGFIPIARPVELPVFIEFYSGALLSPILKTTELRRKVKVSIYPFERFSQRHWEHFSSAKGKLCVTNVCAIVHKT